MKNVWNVVFAFLFLLPLAGCEEEERTPNCEEEKETTPTTPPASWTPEPPLYVFDFKFVDERTQEPLSQALWNNRKVSTSCSGFSGPITYHYFKVDAEFYGVEDMCEYVRIGSPNSPFFTWHTEWIHFETYSFEMSVEGLKTYNILLEQEFTNRGDCDEERKVHIYLDGEHIHEAKIRRVVGTDESEFTELFFGYNYLLVPHEYNNVQLPIDVSGL